MLDDDDVMIYLPLSSPCIAFLRKKMMNRRCNAAISIMVILMMWSVESFLLHRTTPTSAQRSSLTIVRARKVSTWETDLLWECHSDQTPRFVWYSSLTIQLH